MKIFVNTKNNALVETLVVPDGHVPRVGEVLVLPDQAEMCSGMTTFLVIDVTWLLERGKLSAEVTVLAADPVPNRHFRLSEWGWLAPLD